MGNNLQNTAGADYNLSRNRLTFCFLTVTLSAHRLGPSGGGFLASARKSIRSSLKGALTAASSRRRADVLVVRLPPAIDSLDSLRDAPPSLKNSFRHAFTSEKQCFGGVLSKAFGNLKSMINQTPLLFSQSENSPPKPKPVLYSAPVRTLAWNTRMMGF